MTPERMARLVRAWARLYTGRLPAPTSERRTGELNADLHDQVEHEHAAGTADRRIALSILSRMVRGMPADLAWRRQVQTSRGDFVKPLVAVLVVALGIAALALVLDSTALVLLSIAAIGGVILGTVALGVQGARQGDFVVPFMAILVSALALAALGVGAIVMGEQQDAPGLVLLGTAIIVSVVVGALALGSRTAQRSR